MPIFEKKKNMYRIALILSLMSFCSSLKAQVDGTEIGVDGAFSYSSSLVKTGNVGIGLKYGFVFNENFIVGPSFRYQRTWTNNTLTGMSSGFNIYGGGVFGHYRIANYLFLGAELEFLRSPFTNNGFLTQTSSKWVGTCLLGGGFSHLFNDTWRLNAGIYYDIMDVPNPTNPNNTNPNSPLQPYTLRKANGTIIPVLYRIAVFFPIG
jgi:hypothetical protein